MGMERDERAGVRGCDLMVICVLFLFFAEAFNDVSLLACFAFFLAAIVYFALAWSTSPFVSAIFHFLLPDSGPGGHLPRTVHHVLLLTS
jgi:hypothetical protein